jgi:serine protease Do
MTLTDKQASMLLSAASGAAASLAVLVLAGGFFILYPSQAANIFPVKTETVSSAQAATPPQVNANQGNAVSIADVVKQVRSSVVAITIKQQVPTYSNSGARDPFEEFFGTPSPFGNAFPPPTRQTPNGSKEVEVGGGTGFLISTDGYIVTNKHVVDGGEGTSYVVTTDDEKTHDAKVIAKDPIYDIAVIKIEGTDYPHVTFGNSDTIQVGETAIAIGNALAEFRNTVSVGVISGLSRHIVAGDGMGSAEQLDNLIQTDAAINPGNSGGPLLNAKGEVIGVNVATASAENIGFAIPSNLVNQIVTSVQKTGKIERAFLGIRYVQITDELQQRNQLPVNYGALVVRGDQQGDIAVVPGSAADKAGITENDIVLEIDGAKIDDQHPLATLIAGKRIGDTVTLKVLHKGETKTIQAVLTPRG